MPEVRSSELCWGQRYHWLRYHQVPPGARHDAHIVANCPLPEGLSLSRLRAVLDHLVLRHETLRTVYDADALPWPRQRVQPPGPLPLRVASTDADGTAGPAAVVAELAGTEFDMATEWPMRACAVTTGGVPVRLVVVFNHVAFDDGSLEVFKGEFEELLTAAVAGRPARLPAVAHQPTDLAALEAARPAAEREAALRHWREEAARVPADQFARRRVPRGAGERPTASGGPAQSCGPAEPGGQVDSGGPVAYGVSLTSPELLPVVREIAARHAVWPSAVHLAAYAVTMAAYCGEERIALRQLTSHRGAGPRTSALTCMFSPALVCVDLGGTPRFSEVVRRVAERARLAQQHAYAAYDEVIEALALEGERRGRTLRAAPEVNFLTHAGRSCGSRRERLVRNAEPVAWARSATDAYLRVHEWDDGVTVALDCLAEVMEASDAERFLRGYARLLQAHRDGTADLDFAAMTALPGFPPVPDRGGAPADPPERPDDPASLTALTGVVARVNGLASVDAGRGYTGAGGRVLRLPRVAAELRAAGWTGLEVSDFTGARPLAALARRMVPVG
ncbi:hypothetical protein K7472_10705 [Streptomyces sp. PTM05]|uniref:Condensation domain-containing protein n=1 Tax=Streptantibioticus parmotrematis TaxID=2873249 RepID=A0ABS7QSF3_9ACTN|nr:condensation domain-containing protein [Streptantibioticus parmotrematis]MBY8885315.1 hypothetical protein [Streptantibioticus parmotrematis]